MRNLMRRCGFVVGDFPKVLRAVMGSGISFSICGD